MNVYPFIEAENASSGNVKCACELLEVSRAAYYAYYARRTAGPSARARVDAALPEKIIEVHDESNGTYGTPRIHAELGAHNLFVRVLRTALLTNGRNAGLELVQEFLPTLRRLTGPDLAERLNDIIEDVHRRAHPAPRRRLGPQADRGQVHRRARTHRHRPHRMVGVRRTLRPPRPAAPKPWKAR